MGTTAEELRLRAEIDQQRADLTRDFEMVGDKVSPSRIVERRTEAAKGRLRSIRDAVMGTADDATSATADRLGSMRHSAGDMAGQVSGAVSHTEDRIEQGTRGNPLAAGVVAFGFGLLVATVIPESRRERELARKVQPQLEHAAQVAVEAGQDVADQLAPAVQEAGSQIGQTAKDAAGELGQSVKDHAGDTVDTAKDAAHDVKERSSS
jgi:gas vesicle protein